MDRVRECTKGEFREAEQHISEIQSWLDSHPLDPMQVQQRVDRVREMSRWKTYLGNLSIREHCKKEI